MRRSAFVLLVALLGAGVLAAQRAPLPPGTRVRATPVDTHAAYLIGTVVGQTGDTIVILIEPSDTARVSLASLESLEVSQGRRRHMAQGAGWGLLIGTAAGTGIGAATTEGEWQGLGALVGAGAGALAGLLLGTAVGGSIQTERWEAAPGWQLGISLLPAGAGVRIAILF